MFDKSWIRLCRRIVRDFKFRGSDAAFTLKLWENVRRGERLYISPYKENADLMFDSSLATGGLIAEPHGLRRLLRPLTGQAQAPKGQGYPPAAKS